MFAPLLNYICCQTGETSVCKNITMFVYKTQLSSNQGYVFCGLLEYKILSIAKKIIPH